MSKIDKIKKAPRKLRNWLFYESDMKSILLLLTKIYIFFIQHFFLFIEKIMGLFMKTNIKESRFFNKQEIETKQKILWCSVCNDRYIPGLKVLLYSIKQHNPDFDYPFKIYFNNDISEDNQKLIKDLYPHIIFESNSTFSHLKTWFMCLLPFKETEYDKVIFIDADILCLGDVSHLINYDCQHFSACLDVNMKIFWNTQFNMPSFHEFNTGLFVIPKRLLTDGMKPTNIFNDLLILANKYPDAKLGDQTILNRYFAHKTITKLPGKYNAKKEIFSRQKCRHKQHDVRFLHFTGADKPFLINNQERLYIKNKNSKYYDILYELYYDYSRSLQFSFNYLDYTINKTNKTNKTNRDIDIEVICQQTEVSLSIAEHFYIKYQDDIINAIIAISDLREQGTYQEYLSENNLP